MIDRLKDDLFDCSVRECKKSCRSSGGEARAFCESNARATRIACNGGDVEDWVEMPFDRHPRISPATDQPSFQPTADVHLIEERPQLRGPTVPSSRLMMDVFTLPVCLSDWWPICKSIASLHSFASFFKRTSSIRLLHQSNLQWSDRRDRHHFCADMM